jgi:putative phage-type endonuclease
LKKPEGPFRVLVEDAEKERERWREIRRSTGISASKIPAILGNSPFETPLSCWAKYRGEVEDQAETDQMWWGSRLQEIVAGRVAEDEGLYLMRDERLLQSEEHPIFLATCDDWFFKDEDLTVIDSLAEVKTVKSGSFWENGVPQHVQDQCQGQMIVTGQPRVRVCVFFRAEAAHYWAFIERDDAYIEQIIIPKCEEFWKMVQDGTPPAPTSSDTDVQAIKDVWPEVKSELRATLPVEFFDKHTRLESINEELKVLNKEKTGLQNEFKAAIGEFAAGKIEGSNVGYTYGEETRKAYTVQEKTYRVLRKRKMEEE